MAKPLEDFELYQQLVASLKTAAHCAHGLAHNQSNPQYLSVRDMLEKVAHTVTLLAASKAVPGYKVNDMLSRRIASRAN